MSSGTSHSSSTGRSSSDLSTHRSCGQSSASPLCLNQKPSAMTGSSITDASYEVTSYASGSSCFRHRLTCSLLAALAVTSAFAAFTLSAALYLDDFAGSSDRERDIDSPYQTLGKEQMDAVIFYDVIPNDPGTVYKFVDLAEAVDSRSVVARKGLFSQCKRPLRFRSRIDTVQSPTTYLPCRPDGIKKFGCPVVAVRNIPLRLPEVISWPFPKDGCFTKDQRCDGILDCPSGHDEIGCPDSNLNCSPDKFKCPGKNVCIENYAVCNGRNDCGMYEEEMDCCGIDGFIRCNNGNCVVGTRCDGLAECLDLSDEYNCPVPSSDEYYLCDDGQLIEGKHVCDASTSPSQPYQCHDLSDETNCDSHRASLLTTDAFLMREGVVSAGYDREARCFEQKYVLKATNNSGGANEKDTLQSLPVKIALLAGFAIAVALSWIIFVMATILSLRDRIPAASTAARILVAMIVLSALSATAQLACVVYWAMYVKSANNLLTSTHVPVQTKVYYETLLATGTVLQLKMSTMLTLACIAAHVACIIMCWIIHCLYTSSRKVLKDSLYEKEFTDSCKEMKLLLSTPDENTAGENDKKAIDALTLNYFKACEKTAKSQEHHCIETPNYNSEKLKDTAV